MTILLQLRKKANGLELVKGQEVKKAFGKTFWPPHPATSPQPLPPEMSLTRVVGEVRLLLFDHHPRPWVPVPIDPTLAHGQLFVQGVKVFLLEALLGVGWAGL